MSLRTPSKSLEQRFNVVVLVTLIVLVIFAVEVFTEDLIMLIVEVSLTVT